MREFPFVAPEGGRVIVSAAIVMNRWVLYVEHLVEDDVLYDPTRHVVRVERFTYHDRFVRRVVMCKDPVCFLRRPCHYRLGKLTAKIPKIQILKYLIQIINRALMSRDDLAPVGTLSIVRSLSHFRGIDVARINSVGLSRHALSQQFCNENISKSVVGSGRHVAAHIGDPHENPTVAYADRLVQPDVRIIRDVDIGNRAIRIESPESLLVEFSNLIERDVAQAIGHDVAKIIDSIALKMVSNYLEAGLSHPICFRLALKKWFAIQT
ncbi:hypothetical protein BH18ACI3_BH18ACI3_14970 [soil metagenome]